MSVITRHLKLVSPAGQALAHQVTPPEQKKKHKAVQNGELVYTSVSQIQKFTPEAGGCPAKWFFRYVLGLPDDPPGKGAQRGTQGHGRIEDYLEDGIDVLDNLERKGKKFMPEPNVRPDRSRHPVPVLVEAPFGPVFDEDEKPGKKKRKREPFVSLTADGVPVIGFIDLIDPRDPRWLWLKDWKFKKSIADYGAKPRDLLNPKHEAGIQIIGYLEALRLARNAGVFSQALAIPAHVTFQTGSPAIVEETTPVEADGVTVRPIQLDSAQELWLTVTRSAIPGMRQAAKAKSHTEVPKNTTVCRKYNKACPYLGTCQDRMARIRQGFKAKAPAPAVQTEETLMRLLGKMTGNTTPATGTAEPIPSQSAQKPPEVKLAPGQATLTAGLARPNTDYTVKSQACRFLTLMEMGGVKYASFSPTAGGPPVLVGLDEPITDMSAPLVTPSDVPKSDPAAQTVDPKNLTTIEKLPPEGILVTACAMGEKYDVNGQIGEYTGNSREWGFFQTTAGTVKLALTDRVKALKGAAETPAETPKETVTAQGPAAASSAGGNPPQGSEAPKGEGSPSGAEVKPEKKKREKGERRTLTVEPGAEVKPTDLPAVETKPVTGAAAIAQLAAIIQPPMQGQGGDKYGPLEGVMLYIGCTPLGVAAQTLGPYVDGLESEIIKRCQLNICDLRVAQDQTFGFNKWKGFLAEVAKENPPPPGHYISLGYADERVACVVETLAARIAALHPGNVVKAG